MNFYLYDLNGKTPIIVKEIKSLLKKNLLLILNGNYKEFSHFVLSIDKNKVYPRIHLMFRESSFHGKNAIEFHIHIDVEKHSMKVISYNTLIIETKKYIFDNIKKLFPNIKIKTMKNSKIYHSKKKNKEIKEQRKK